MKQNALLTLIAAIVLPAVPAFAGHCCQGGGYWGAYMVGGTVVWIALAATMLFYTWNMVLAKLFSFKKASFTQALLFVATLAVFCAPRHMMHGCHGMQGGCKMGCHEGKDKRPAGYDSMEMMPSTEDRE